MEKGRERIFHKKNRGEKAGSFHFRGIEMREGRWREEKKRGQTEM